MQGAYFRFYSLLLENNLNSRIFARLNQRSVRLGVRTQDFHSCNTGSIPVGSTKVGGACTKALARNTCNVSVVGSIPTFSTKKTQRCCKFENILLPL